MENDEEDLDHTEAYCSCGGVLELHLQERYEVEGTGKRGRFSEYRLSCLDCSRSVQRLGSLFQPWATTSLVEMDLLELVREEDAAPRRIVDASTLGPDFDD